MFNHKTLVEQFDAHAKLLASQITIGAHDIPLLRVNKMPIWAQKWLAPFGSIKYIGFHDGSEAMWIVFLDDQLNKFHSTYLAE